MVHRASIRDTAGVVADVLLPLVARGVIVRRPKVLRLLARVDADRRAVRRMQRLRDRYGPAPVLLRIPGRDVALILSAGHVRAVLDGTPEPFTPASREKRAALSHFEPRGVLISRGPERADRRRFNEEVLEASRPVHRLADDLIATVREEAEPMLAAAARSGTLAWDDFAEAWWRIVRRVVLGDGARDDAAVTDLLTALRRDANWAFLRPKRRRLRARFLRELQHHLDRAEPGSLASLVATTPSTPDTAPTEQVPQWLFAFDAAGMATFQALALLDAHPEHAERARTADLPFLRACLLESLRLWPTTPAILRDATAETSLDGATIPDRAGVVVFAPFFHRDEQLLPYADAFTPELWLDGDPTERWPLVPFSAGPAACPGRNLVLLLTGTLLATILAGHELRQDRLDGSARLPATLSPFDLRFAVSPRAAEAAR